MFTDERDLKSKAGQAPSEHIDSEAVGTSGEASGRDSATPGEDGPALLCVGGRPHESDAAFLELLEPLLAVTLHRSVEQEAEFGPQLPLLKLYEQQVGGELGLLRSTQHDLFVLIAYQMKPLSQR